VTNVREIGRFRLTIVTDDREGAPYDERDGLGVAGTAAAPA
jgi:hypothetical protein